MAHFDPLIRWFNEEKRDLPWRNNPSPYATWVSEVMLQQTQVAVVIPYFERWMERFPTIKDLAAASVDEVIKYWEGLGYYSRARNLLEGAKKVCRDFGGKLPNSAEDLAKIKGLGPYTIGAIRSFAYHEKTAAVDGNVLRVIARYFKIYEDIAKGSTLKKIWETVESHLPDQNHWIVNEALIELGATLCNKKPKCQSCPLQKSCASYRDGTAEELPYKSKKVPSIPLYRSVAVICHNELYLVRRGQPGKIMHDLYEFPYFETKKEGISTAELSLKIREEFQIHGCLLNTLDPVAQSFTKFRVQLRPFLYATDYPNSVNGYEWKSLADLNHLAFSSGHKKILKKVLTSSYLPHRV